MARSAALVSRRLACGRGRCRSAAPRRSQLRAAADADAGAISLRRRSARRSRWPTCRGSQVFEDPTLQALIREALANNLDLQLAVARVEEARARAGIAKSFLYPQVDGVASYGVRQASNAQDAGRIGDEDTTHQSGTYGFQLSWEIDLFGRLRRQHEAALALVLASEQARRGVLVTLVGDVATNYFLLRELDLQLEIARQTLRLNDDTVTYFQNRLDGGVSNRLELDRIQAHPGPDRRGHSRARAADRRHRERAVAAARPSAGADRRAAPRRRRACRRRFRPDCRCH